MDIRIGTKLEGPNGATITIDGVLGQGGFGQVFRGKLSDGNMVAVKTVLTSSLDDGELSTLQNEARLAQAIDDPNVVRVLYVNPGEDSAGNPPYVVMELVEGGTLRSVINSHRAAGTVISTDELLAMYEQIANGMRAVNLQLVHRDLKPENILLEKDSGQLKISDFGLAKLADAATRSETFKGWGTRAYQAPEAFENGPNTIAMDIYAAGIVFFELATLIWPIEPRSDDRTPLAWRNAHLLTPPKELGSIRSDFARRYNSTYCVNAPKRSTTSSQVLGHYC